MSAAIPTELAISGSANVMIESYGPAGAYHIATRRAIGLAQHQDNEGAAVWVRIAKAVKETEPQERRADEAAH